MLLKRVLKQQGLKATRQAATMRQTQQLNRQQLKMQRPTPQAHKAITQPREQHSRLLFHKRVLKAITQRRPGRLDMMLLEQQQREQQGRGTQQQLQPLKDTRLNEHQQSEQRQSEPQRKVTAQNEQQQKGLQLRVMMLKKRRQKGRRQKAMAQSVLQALVLSQQIALPQGS